MIEKLVLTMSSNNLIEDSESEYMIYAVSLLFEKIVSIISVANYSVGVYGSSLVCKKLKEANLVDKTWLANASGWGYGTKFSDYNMKQSSSIKIGNITFDKDVAASINAIGAW